jgi:hypothetical protein
MNLQSPTQSENVSTPTRWWLIADSTYRVISKLLEGSLDTLPDSKTREDIRQALHQLDTGLHITDEIPSDYKQ